MVISVLRMFPLYSKTEEVLDILRTVKGPVLAEAGCISCSIYHECEEMALLYVEHWRSMHDLEKHIKSSIYTKILEAMELSALAPEISFYETTMVSGLELVERVRNSYA